MINDVKTKIEKSAPVCNYAVVVINQASPNLKIDMNEELMNAQILVKNAIHSATDMPLI